MDNRQIKRLNKYITTASTGLNTILYSMDLVPRAFGANYTDIINGVHGCKSLVFKILTDRAKQVVGTGTGTFNQEFLGNDNNMSLLNDASMTTNEVIAECEYRFKNGYSKSMIKNTLSTYLHKMGIIGKIVSSIRTNDNGHSTKSQYKWFIIEPEPTHTHTDRNDSIELENIYESENESIEISCNAEIESLVLV